VGLAFDGSGDVSADVTDGTDGIGAGVTVDVSAGIGDMVVDGFGAQPNSNASIKTNMITKFHFIPAS
jgi:hypothetical protein